MVQNPSDQPEAAGPTPGGRTPTGPVPGDPTPTDPTPTDPTASDPTPTGARWTPSGRDVVKRLVGVVAVIVVVWLLYQFLSAFLPRWWAQVIGNAVDGSFAAGAWWGVVVGAVFTAVPVLFAIPNLLTLGIALGTSPAAHAGERILDVDGPAFRGGTAWGAVIGGLVALAIVMMTMLYRRRGTQLKQFRTGEG
jgi:hypothetical protein